jgi:hypothetical protein
MDAPGKFCVCLHPPHTSVNNYLAKCILFSLLYYILQNAISHPHITPRWICYLNKKKYLRVIFDGYKTAFDNQRDQYTHADACVYKDV